jgi:AcrR family transcriptional regulator
VKKNRKLSLDKTVSIHYFGNYKNDNSFHNEKGEMKKEESNLEKEKIIDFSLDKFLREGFYKTSMDTVATELHMSKKTIYKHFSTKEELVEAIVNKFTTGVSYKIESVIKTNEDSLSKAMRLIEIMSSVAMKLSDTWVKDLQIHMPKTWEKIDEFRTKRAYAVVGNIIRQGQAEGMIIEKPEELIIHLFVNSLRSIVNPNFLFYQKFNYQEAFNHTFEILFNGILTPKGKKQFDKIFKKVIQ